MEPDNPLLDDYLLSLVPTDRKPRICFIPTASGDSEGYSDRFLAAFGPDRAEASVLSLFKRSVADLDAFVLDQDVVYVGGGNTANLLAIWRLHGLDLALEKAYRAGVVMAGISAGMNCWFEESVTDSFGTQLAPLHDGLGPLAGSCCPHYDGAALVFAGTGLAEVVSSRPEAAAYRVEPGGEERLAARWLD